MTPERATLLPANVGATALGAEQPSQSFDPTYNRYKVPDGRGGYEFIEVYDEDDGFVLTLNIS